MFDFLDEHLFVFCLLVTVGMQLSFFGVAYTCQFDKVTDFAGGTNFTLLAVLTLVLTDTYYTRQLLVTGMVALSRTELALYLLVRVLQRGKDSRFDEMRQKFFAFLGFWVFQIVWVYGVSVSVIFVNTTTTYNPELEVRDYVGVAMFAIGFIVQVWADIYKHRFRSNPRNKGQLCQSSVWAWSRHPNYFGEILLWWGIFVTCTPVFDGPDGLGWGYLTIASPLLTMAILLLLSGVTISERDSRKRYLQPGDPKGFEKYVRETSVLIPLPPSLYRGIPLLVKQVLLFEWPIFARDASGKLKGLEPEPARPHTPLVVDSGADSPHGGNKA